MNQREAFELWCRKGDKEGVSVCLARDDVGYTNRVIAACWDVWQAAIQHASDVAVRACESRIMGDHNREDQEAQRCADAIKEALK